MPKLEDVVAGRAQFNQIKEVSIEDLLGRDAVELDWTRIRETLTGRRVLVTGGGGSIGSGVVPGQVARLGVHALTIVESCEYNLYQISQELRAAYPELLLNSVLADCGDPIAMRRLFIELCRKWFSMQRPTSMCQCFKVSCVQRFVITCWRRVRWPIWPAKHGSSALY